MNVITLIGKKQFLLKKGDRFFINKICGLINNIVEFNKIIYLEVKENVIFGTPFIKNVSIKAQLISIKKTKKINIIKFKRRKNYLKKHGHRQTLMEFMVQDIIYKGI